MTIQDNQNNLESFMSNVKKTQDISYTMPTPANEGLESNDLNATHDTLPLLDSDNNEVTINITGAYTRPTLPILGENEAWENGQGGTYRNECQTEFLVRPNKYYLLTIKGFNGADPSHFRIQGGVYRIKESTGKAPSGKDMFNCKRVNFLEDGFGLNNTGSQSNPRFTLNLDVLYNDLPFDLESNAYNMLIKSTSDKNEYFTFETIEYASTLKAIPIKFTLREVEIVPVTVDDIIEGPDDIALMADALNFEKTAKSNYSVQENTHIIFSKPELAMCSSIIGLYNTSISEQDKKVSVSVFNNDTEVKAVEIPITHLGKGWPESNAEFGTGHNKVKIKFNRYTYITKIAFLKYV